MALRSGLEVATPAPPGRVAAELSAVVTSGAFTSSVTIADLLGEGARTTMGMLVGVPAAVSLPGSAVAEDLRFTPTVRVGSVWNSYTRSGGRGSRRTARDRGHSRCFRPGYHRVGSIG